jgi:hypothetical protein
VIEDAALSAALEEARRVLGPQRSKASLVRELAVRGSQALVAEQEAYREAAADLTAMLAEDRLNIDAALALRIVEPLDG